MSFDISRLTFNPWSDYSEVVMEQGRVQTDADWNEWLAEHSRRIRAETLDILGRAVYPVTTPYAFQITATSSGGTNSVTIGPGRMYVDGLLAENHGPIDNPAWNPSWDPALDELSGSPQPPPASVANAIDYTQQPYYPNPPLITVDGPFLAYLDVWTRPVTYLQDSNLVDPAIAVDTTGRLQTVWQVKLMAVPTGETWTCSTPESEIPYPAPSTGLLTTTFVPFSGSGPCCLTSGTGYTGMENQCYRVEIHDSSAAASGATFKWSRENASVITGVTSIGTGSNAAGQPASVLTVQSLGRDQVLGFLLGNWIEITDEQHQLTGNPGELGQIDGVDPSSNTITLKTTLSGPWSPTSTNCTRIIRWDSDGAIPVPAANATVVLENGVTIAFSYGAPVNWLNTGDFWSFAARTNGSLDLPLTNAPAQGIYHHYTKLAIVDFSPLSNTDCRTGWPGPAESSCGCCTCTVGDGIESTGEFTSIQQAVKSLPATGGEVCVLPGRYFEHVVVENQRDVIIRGCGTQTRIASPSLQPGSGSEAGTAVGKSGLVAVLTVVGSQHVTLSSLCVEAADGEAGILIDQIVSPVSVGIGDTDVTVEACAITASTLPAIAAFGAELLTLDDNRVAMKDVWSQWAAVSVSGNQISIDGNWVGLQNATNALDWIPESVAADLSLTANAAGSTAATKPSQAPGGIQIGGPSENVYVRENTVEGGSLNGVTLGSVTMLDRSGGDSGIVSGVWFAEYDACLKTRTLGLPPGDGNRVLVAAGPLTNVRIERNRICNMGLCGIGPVGFFDLARTAEVITIKNLSIVANDISKTLAASLERNAFAEAAFSYGAICVPDVENLMIYDNVITDFGTKPGAAGACGIFVLHAQMADISRNQIRETRDWSLERSDARKESGGDLGGIVVLLVTPPSFTSTNAYKEWSQFGTGTGDTNAVRISNPTAVPTYEPGLPALRVEHNVVRVALGEALQVFGYGPFSIVNNNFSTGGTIETTGISYPMTVLVLNLGLSLEIASVTSAYSDLFKKTLTSSVFTGYGTYAGPSNGTVLFANNVCQLEARVNGERGRMSVFIATFDHLLFTNNLCWLDARELCAALDAFLLGITVQVTGNRFQEAITSSYFQDGVGSVMASGLTAGFANITSQNVSTYCLFALPSMLTGALNVMLLNQEVCERLQQDIQKELGNT